MVESPTAYNRAYLTSCLRHSAQIQPNGWTSDTLGTLSAIADIEKKIWQAITLMS